MYITGSTVFKAIMDTMGLTAIKAIMETMYGTSQPSGPLWTPRT
jgi:hypothetical protein